MGNFILLFLLLISFNSFALEIDERLTMRIIKVSESSKTVLINRGAEDGLIEGDHAKFFLSVGVVARAVTVKVSPTRSVWSIYRLVNAEYIKNDQVMKLKIATPVKVTKDETRMIVKDDTPVRIDNTDPRNLGIPLSDDANDLDADDDELVMSTGDDVDLASVSNMSTSIVEKQWEFFGSIRYESLSSTSSPDDSSGNYTASEGNTVLTFGFEHYFKNESKWYARISPIASLSIRRSNLMNFKGSNSIDDANEFGFGVNWHPLEMPHLTNKFIAFGNFTYYMGSVRSTYNPGSEDTSGDSESEAINGSISGYSIGGGGKYYLAKGYGFRIILDYVNLTEKFTKDSIGVQWSRSRIGPRTYMGISYRY